jgi:hypothetical protein
MEAVYGAKTGGMMLIAHQGLTSIATMAITGAMTGIPGDHSLPPQVTLIAAQRVALSRR